MAAIIAVAVIACQHDAFADPPITIPIDGGQLVVTDPSFVVERIVLGSVRVVTDATGAVLRRHDYLPFGKEYNPQTPFVDRRLFTGKERDFESGLDYFGARYYRADLGRFTTVDPEMNAKDALVDPQRWNRYAYVTNNPLKFTDPDGKNPLLIMGGAGVVVFGGWKVATNLWTGRPWHQNVGYEATKGFLIGSTLGLAALAAPALTTTDLVARRQPALRLMLRH